MNTNVKRFAGFQFGNAPYRYTHWNSEDSIDVCLISLIKLLKKFSLPYFKFSYHRGIRIRSTRRMYLAKTDI